MMSSQRPSRDKTLWDYRLLGTNGRAANAIVSFNISNISSKASSNTIN
jgi:hypothetical protein